MSWIKTRARAAIVRHVRSRFQQVEPEPVQGLFNFQCFDNCAEWLRQRPGQGLAIVECIYIDEGVPILHYMIRAGSVYQEITLGYRANQLEYYPVRELLPTDKVHDEFERSLYAWKEQFVPWWALRFVGRVL